MRFMEGANIHQVANNRRTSVQMVERFYASHIKDRLDAAAINVQRPKPTVKAATGKSDRPPRRVARQESRRIRPHP
jgi:hypothetical protein